MTLQLSVAAVTGDDGSAVGSAPAVLGARSVTVPAGATVTVPLRIDPTAKLAAAQYGDVTGRVVATGGASVSTPFSLYVAPPTVDLTIRMKDRLGQPGIRRLERGRPQHRLRPGATGLERRQVTEQIFKVRPGTYFLSGFVTTPDAPPAAPVLDSMTYLARPELKVTGDMTVDLDATKAHLRERQDRPAEPGQGLGPVVQPHLGRHLDPLPARCPAAP